MPFERLGVVLAAGAGRRMGGPKALLLTPAGPLLVRHVNRLREAGCARVAVVVAPEVRTAVTKLFSTAEAPCFVSRVTASPFESLLCGARALGVEAHSRLAVVPVDTLPAARDTLETLFAALGAGIRAVSPRCEGVGGHPPVLEGSVLEGLTRESNLADVLEALGSARRRLDVHDANVTDDFDTPHAFESVFQAAPRFVSSQQGP